MDVEKLATEIVNAARDERERFLESDFENNVCMLCGYSLPEPNPKGGRKRLRHPECAALNKALLRAERGVLALVPADSRHFGILKTWLTNILKGCFRSLEAEEMQRRIMREDRKAVERARRERQEAARVHQREVERVKELGIDKRVLRDVLDEANA